MAVFIVRHEHSPDSCPAHDPYMGAGLLNHLSRSNLRQYGVEIQGEAVVSGEHTLYLILEASDEQRVHAFLAPFEQAGRVEVFPASTCARVVASGGCAADPPVVDDVVPALDPEEAGQRAIEAGLLVHRVHPLNCETSIPDLIGGVVMPNAHFYVRNHFQIPALDPTTWALQVGGLVDRPLRLTLRDLHNMPTQTAVVTLECAGNGRFQLEPPVPGEQWRLGAVSTAEWTGVPLAEVLDRVGVQSAAREIVFRGADNGTVEDRPEPIRFERSLGVDDARDSGALLAYAMNGETIPIQHGAPLRLVVPGWYGVASVKWLTEIEAVDHPFDGFFQADRYFYERASDGAVRKDPVTLQEVRALITEPRPDQEVDGAELAIRGVAWSGAAPIARVEVRIDDGPWRDARLVGERRRGSWQWWELIARLERPGGAVISARATDMAGRAQPEEPVWNRLGYGNNAIQEVSVRRVS
jgi:DMSO/TMAO reductase YedYZ molybdopterin-dependent catalytic subunit